MLKSLRTLTRVCNVPLTKWRYGNKKLNTQVFSDLTWGELATPQLTKKLIIKPIHMHSMVSQRSLFHKKRVTTKIRTCFSQKKSRVFRRVNKVKKYFYSDVLGQKIFATVSMHAYKCIRKMESFDNYILCTKPKQLDSKFGEYLREVMLRKINDDNFRIPYIIGTNRQKRIKQFEKYLYNKRATKIVVPKEYKQTFRTFQRRFGANPQELNEQDYKKYTQLEDLRRKLGKQLDPAHPLLLELREKMRIGQTDEELKKLDELSKTTTEQFLNAPNQREIRRYKVEQAKKQIQNMENKMREITFKIGEEE